MPAYRKTINDRDAIKDEIRENKEKQKGVRRYMKVLETDLANLEEEARKLKEQDLLAGITKKRLRESLSEKERALLILGGDIAERRLKRAKSGTKSEDGTSEDDD